MKLVDFGSVIANVAARLVLTGAVATTLTVAQVPDAYAHCGNPTLHEAFRALRDLERDPRFASPAAQAQISALRDQLQQALQAWMTATKQATQGSTVAIQTRIVTIRDQIQHARAQSGHPFG
jgi:hypothetical protein